MGKMHEMEFASGEHCSREAGLRMHCQTNFFPPHPKYVVDKIVESFNKYWKGEMTTDELYKECYLRQKDGLYRYFESFLNEEDQ